jgi:hypothetical protein
MFGDENFIRLLARSVLWAAGKEIGASVESTE